MKVKLNFWDDEEVKQAVERQAKKEDRDVSNFLRHKIKLIRKQEKW